MNQPYLAIPSSDALIDFFGGPPEEEDDGYRCYAAIDTRGIKLRFSFDVFERSVQTELEMNGSRISTTVHEGADVIRIDGNLLYCSFTFPGSHANLVVRILGSILVEWSSLRAE